MHPWRIIALSGSGIGALALLLPFATFPVIGPVDGFDGDAWPVLILLGPIVAAALIGPWREGLPPVLGLPAILLGAAAIVFSSVKLSDAVLAARSVDGSVGAGAWLLLVATVLVGAGAVGSLSRRVR